MENKNEMTIEELQQQYDKLTAKRKLLKEQLEKRKQEYERERQEKLAKEKELRKQAVIEAQNRYGELFEKYIKDYNEDPDGNTFFFKTWNYIV